MQSFQAAIAGRRFPGFILRLLQLLGRSRRGKRGLPPGFFRGRLGCRALAGFLDSSRFDFDSGHFGFGRFDFESSLFGIGRFKRFLVLQQI